MYNTFQPVRDGIFPVEIASALSSSTNIWFLLQSGGCVATRREESLQPGPAAYGFAFPHLGTRQQPTLPLLATQTPLLQCWVDRHDPNVTKLAQYFLQARWLRAQLEHDVDAQVGARHVCNCAATPPLCINLPFILGNSRQQCSAPRKRAGDVSFQCSGTCARVASSHRRAPYPKAPARPAPCPAVWSPSPVFQLR